MKLVFRGHDDRYAVEQSLLAFFPEERPVYQEPEPGEDNWARVDLHQGPVYATATTEIAHGGRLGRGTSRALLRDVTDEYERERLRQKAVKLSFFKAARSITGVTPAWGALTGIRPGKLAARLKAEGKNPFILTSKEPNGQLLDFMMGETRFASLTRTFPETAKVLFAEAEEFCAQRYAKYKHLAEQ